MRLARTIATLARARRRLADRRGNVTIIFAFSAIPTFGLVAFAIDYGSALHAKSKLDIAADAASMVAVTTAKTVIAASNTTGQAVTDSAIAEARRQALLAFAANAGKVAFTSVPTPTVEVTRVNQKLTATVSYATQATNNIITMMGLGRMNLSGVSVSTLSMPTYINYYIVVDASQSMGVGSTPDNMKALYDRVVKFSNYDSQANADSKTGCVFGCHVPQANGYTQPDTNENLAHNKDGRYEAPYIDLRIDSARYAIQNILQDAKDANTQAGTNLIQVGIYTMQQDPTNAGSYIQSLVDPPSSNFAAMSTTAKDGPLDRLDLGNNTGAGIGDSGFTNSINDFAQNKLSAQGDGSTAAAPLKYVFLVTDGIFDTPGGSCTYGHCTGAFDDSLCSQLRSKATVGVIYTTYNPVYNKNDPTQGYQDAYYKLVFPSKDQIAPNLQACTSGSQYYYEATDGPGIIAGMQKLFASTAQAARLTQ